jgi:hypothetical protein
MPTGPGSQPFIARHFRTIRLISFGLFLLGMIAFVLYPSACQFSRALAWHGFRRQMDLRFAWISFLGGMTIASAWGSPLVGLLPVFERNVTRLKRVILLVLCLLPLAFFLSSQAVASSELAWRDVQTGLVFCLPGWTINGSPIVAGQPFLRVIWRVARGLRLVPHDDTESR